MNTRPAKVEDVRRSTLSVPDVLSADSVFGPYDIICPVRALNLTHLEEVILNIQTRVSGIESTLTCLVKEIY